MKRVGWWWMALGAGLFIAAGHACVERSVKTLGPGGGGFDKATLAASLGENVIVPTFVEFASAAEALAQATAAHATAPSAETLQAARDAWRAAMGVWQRAQLMQLGPAGDSVDIPGGRDLGDAIYSWPLVNTCAVDQKLVDGSYQSPTSLGEQLVHVRGLDAIEYLLFRAGDANSCPPQSTINTDGTWVGVQTELVQRRADYAHSAAVLVSEAAKQLRDAWLPSGDNFVAELSSSGSVYPSPQAALNAIADAMFYLDRITKDLKLGEPAGLSMCATATCPDSLESPYAAMAKANIHANLLAFQTLLVGGNSADDLGFDDLLVALGHAEVADELTAATAAALSAEAAIEEEDLAVALQDDLASVRALHEAVKTVTDLLKSDFITLLDVDLPMGMEGDND